MDAGLEEWRTGGKLARLWNGDATLWTGADESKWLGWLGIVDQQLAEIGKFEKLAREMRESRFKHCLLLGMGGSSLCPEVLKYTFGKQKGYPELLVLDSTDPQQIRAFEKRIDYDSTLFVVASKSSAWSPTSSRPTSTPGPRRSWAPTARVPSSSPSPIRVRG